MLNFSFVSYNENPSLLALDLPTISIVKFNAQFLPDITGANVEKYPYTFESIGESNKK